MPYTKYLTAPPIPTRCPRLKLPEDRPDHSPTLKQKLCTDGGNIRGPFWVLKRGVLKDGGTMLLTRSWFCATCGASGETVIECAPVEARGHLSEDAWRIATLPPALR